MPVGPTAGTVAVHSLTSTRKDTMPPAIADGFSAIGSWLSQPAVSNLGTLAVAFAAAAALWLDWRREKERTEAVDAELATKAYLLLRELSPKTQAVGGRDRLIAAENRRNELHNLAGQAETLLELAPRASKKRTQAARKAAVALLQARARFSEAASASLEPVEGSRFGKDVQAHLPEAADQALEEGDMRVAEAERQLRQLVDSEMLEAGQDWGE